jgi:hypothetical protein
MAQAEDPAQAAARLEAALERIAFASDRLTSAPTDADAPPTAVLAEVATRLDGLIAQLRRALAKAAAPSE